MTKEELAAQLNGNEICSEIGYDLEAEAKLAGLVVVYGASDDLVELRGTICEELGAYDGIKFKIGPSGLPKNECDDMDCPYFKKQLEDIHHSINVEWGKNGYSWFITGTMGCAFFDIMEDGEKFCRGIVFSMGLIRIA